MFRRQLLGTCATFGLIASCSDDSEEATAGLDDVVFVNDISDEALARLLEQTPVNEPAERLEIYAPSADAVLPKTTPVSFSWRKAGSARRPAVPAQPSRLPRLLHALETFLSPIGVAHAHGAPYTGPAYYLVFSVPNNAQLLRVFTAARSYTPDDASWAKLSAARGPIRLDISSAIFENSLIVSDGGPFLGATTQFTLE